MACCMAALVLVYQLIDGWQRWRRWWTRPLGRAARAGSSEVSVRDTAVVATGAFASGFSLAFLVLHGPHFRADPAALLMSGVAMCRALL